MSDISASFLEIPDKSSLVFIEIAWYASRFMILEGRSKLADTSVHVDLLLNQILTGTGCCFCKQNRLCIVLKRKPVLNVYKFRWIYPQFAE